MISETRLTKELEERFNSYIEQCSALSNQQVNGYKDCFNDVNEIIQKMVEENRIKARARRAVKKFLGNQPAL